LRLARLGITGIMLIVGGAIFIGYLYFVGFLHVISVIESLNVSIFLSTILIDLSAIVIYALSWKILVGKNVLKVRDSIEIVLISIFGDLMIPTGSVSAEIIRITLTTKKTRLRAGEVTATVLLHRLLLGTTFGIVLAISIVALVFGSKVILPQFLLFLILAVIFFALGVLGIYASFNARRFMKIVEDWSTRIYWLVKLLRIKIDIQEFRSRVMEGYEMFSDAITSIKRGTILVSALMLIVQWFILALIPYLMFISLNHPEPFQVILVVSILISMIQTIPIGIPGLVGVIEISMTAFFIGFGIPADIAASATILTRLITFWFELLIGAVVASFEGVRGLMSNTREEVTSSGHFPPTQFLTPKQSMVKQLPLDKQPNI
jgi:hypothetical protein